MTNELDNANIPNHVAIIMDGNGRWAKKRHLPRIAGHKRGMEVVKDITTEASNLGVKVLTLYAFSTENWKRPEKEVRYLMSLPAKFFDDFVPSLIKNNVRVATIGDISGLPEQTQKAVYDAINDTKECTGMILNFALNYGSRDEIVHGIKEIAEKVKNGTMNINDISDKTVSDHLMTSFLGENADPDLLIRTSGEERVSNFLLWQIAYSELEFVDQYWPDFTPENFKNTIIQFQQRHRRFGGLDAK